MSDLDNLCINTIRFLSVDAVERAKSGHPGTPMGAAVMAYVLWDRFLTHNPANPKWPDRDRFVLSCGHASMLLYSLLYLTGYGLTVDDLKSFRQWGSRTPGHPEYGLTPGVEATTGPLGQGFGNAVGMAIAERFLAARYNRPGHEIIDHLTYVLASDGDLEEGVSSEAASLAGTLRLSKLVVIYDSNGISIEGKTDKAFTEDVGARFRAYGWNVIGPIDGSSLDSVGDALEEARSAHGSPTLIICRTVIGYGAPNKAGTGAVHGEPLGPEEALAARKNLGWNYEPFVVPEEALAHFREAIDRGKWAEEAWVRRMEAYRGAFPEMAKQIDADLSGDLPAGWDQNLTVLFKDLEKPVATREASGRIMNEIARHLPSFAGGSADLAPSTRTELKGEGDFSAENYRGRNFHFGVREHAMGAISNGMALHGGMLPFAGTFLIFYDYMRPAVRLAAISGVRVIYVFTHDSVGLGQDGPTHQPVEHLAGLRAVPNLVTMRPADAFETAGAWRIALNRRYGPTALVLTRQNLPVLDHSPVPVGQAVDRGGYVMWEGSHKPDIILIATGSEVSIALQAGRMLKEKGIAARVVSLPSWELFAAQPREYRDAVLPPEIKKRISIEAASTFGWERWVGDHGLAIGIDRFGASAPGDVIYQKLGFTPERVVAESLRLLGK